VYTHVSKPSFNTTTFSGNPPPFTEEYAYETIQMLIICLCRDAYSSPKFHLVKEESYTTYVGFKSSTEPVMRQSVMR